VILPGGGENLKTVYDRIQKPLQEILLSVAQKGHVLVVAHRNINKMLIKCLLGLDFEAGYRVEHRNNWLYIFAPHRQEIYLMKINSPVGDVEIVPGYEEIA
jgi:broad specificity phosphatase PhoE